MTKVGRRAWLKGMLVTLGAAPVLAGVEMQASPSAPAPEVGAKGAYATVSYSLSASASPGDDEEIDCPFNAEETAWDGRD